MNSGTYVGIHFLLFLFLSCSVENQELIISTSQEMPRQLNEVQGQLEMLPFDLNGKSVPVGLKVNGKCTGLVNNYFYISSDESEILSDSAEVVHVDFVDQTIISNADTFITNNDSRYLTNSSTGKSKSDYLSSFDCQGTGEYSFYIHDPQIIMNLITKQCSHDEVFKFYIKGVLQSGQEILIENEVTLDKSECDTYNVCSSNFKYDGTNTYLNELGFVATVTELYQRKTNKIATISSIANPETTELGKYGPLAFCNEEQLFNEFTLFLLQMYANDTSLFDSGFGTAHGVPDLIRVNKDFIYGYLLNDIDASGSTGLATVGYQDGATVKFALRMNFHGFDHSISGLTTTNFNSSVAPNFNMDFEYSSNFKDTKIRTSNLFFQFASSSQKKRYSGVRNLVIEDNDLYIKNLGGGNQEMPSYSILVSALNFTDFNLSSSESFEFRDLTFNNNNITEPDTINFVNYLTSETFFTAIPNFSSMDPLVEPLYPKALIYSTVYETIAGNEQLVSGFEPINYIRIHNINSERNTLNSSDEIINYQSELDLSDIYNNI